MSRTFWGVFDHKVDQKGRVSVPADYRRVIEAGDPSFGQGRRPQLAIVYGLDDDYLVGYTIEEITKYEERIGKMRNSPLKRQLVRRLISKSFRTEIDNDGRLVLPQERRMMWPFRPPPGHPCPDEAIPSGWPGLCPGCPLGHGPAVARCGGPQPAVWPRPPAPRRAASEPTWARGSAGPCRPGA